MRRRYLPILFGLITIVIVNFQVISQQLLIHNGQPMFVALEPVDPRSLIQGDYMVLTYNLNISKVQINDGFQEQSMNEKINDEIKHKRLKVTIDDRAVLVSSSFDGNLALETNQHWLNVKQEKYGNFYPASNSYLFAEGLAYCYEQAEYAELRVREDGRALLYRLTDANLVPLNCESKDQREQEEIPSIFD